MLGVRQRGSFALAVLATAILALAACSGVLFLASAGTAALHNEAAQECPEAGVPAVTDDRGPNHYPSALQAPAALPRLDQRVRTAFGRAGLPGTDLVVTANVAIGGRATDTALLFAQSGALRYVTRLSGGGSGLWLPASYASAHGLHPGSTMAIGTGTARVAGIYRDLAPTAFVPLFALPRFWCNWRDAIVPTPFNRPPPLLLADRSTLLAVAPSVDATWYARVDVQAQTVPVATAGLVAAQRMVAALGPDLRLRTDLPYLLAKAGRERGGLRGPVLPIDLAGVLVAACLVAAAGTYWGVRRRRELYLLSSRGVGPAALGCKAALEMLPATAAGTLLGWGAGIVLVRALGPSAQLEPGAPAAALGLAAVAGFGALVVLAALAARAVPGERIGHAGRLRRVPWELALLAASGLAYAQVRRDGAVRVAQATVHVNPWVLAFPLLALTAATVLFARSGTLGLARVRRSTARLPAAVYLAARRLTGMPLVAAGALVGVTLPVAVLLYSSALTGSTSDVVQRKVQTNVGAPYAFGTLTPGGTAPELRGDGTVVSMIQVDPRVDGDIPALVLGLDPASFTRFAYGGAAVTGLVQRLTLGTGPVRAVLVNAPGLPGRSVTIGAATLPLEVVARTSTFPGLRDPYSPLVVVNGAALPRLDPAVDLTREVWTDPAHLQAALAALRADGVAANYEISPATFLDSTGLRPVTWLFDYLRALAYLIGLIAVAGLGFALAARTRRHALAYHLARRMGLSRRRHRRSLAVEIGALLAASWVAACAFALAAVGLVYRLTDPYPVSPPPPVLPVPVATALGAAAACALLGAVAVALVQRALDRARPAGLLR